MGFDELKSRVREFAHAREWERFHTPKNLAMAAAAESGELLEIFQWLTEAESQTLSEDQLEAVRLEVADVLIYLLRLADVLGIDVERSIADKIAINAARYPVETARGLARKFDAGRDQ